MYLGVRVVAVCLVSKAITVTVVDAGPVTQVQSQPMITVLVSLVGSLALAITVLLKFFRTLGNANDVLLADSPM